MPGNELVNLADKAISAGKVSRSSGNLLRQVLSQAGIGDTLSPLGAGSFPSLAEIFDTLVSGYPPALWRHFDQVFEVIARPGERLTQELQASDFFLRRALGEGRLAHLAIVVTGEVLRAEELAAAGLRPEGGRPGLYVQVVDTGAFPHRSHEGFARRIADKTGRLGDDQMVIRLRDNTISAEQVGWDSPQHIVTETDRPAEQTANTDPTHWFLTEAEIEAARGGGDGPRRTLSIFTSRNLVQPLVDGEEMMRALRDDLVATRRGDFIHFTAWRMDRGQNLVLTSPSTGTSPNTVTNLWRGAIRRGVTSRTLLWRPAGGALIPGDPGRTGRENDATQNMLESAGGEAVLDARFPSFGSHHQKSAIVQRNGEAVAYCGGIDLAGDRWDTRRHNNDRRRLRELWYGWHDVHARIRGPAVLDIEHNFRDRWNDSKFPIIVPVPVPPPRRITTPLPPVASGPGTHHVQVLRTYACQSNQYPSFAPRGEFTCLAGYRKAIGRAQTYIYLEDQYLVWDELARELARALGRIQKLIIVVPQRTDAPEAEFNWHQNNFIRILRATHPNKVYVYHLIQPGTGQPIYVHSKLMIVDDIYAVVGTPNIGRRSMTHDTEIAVAVVDADIVDGVCRFARNLRRNLWGEHLNLPTSDSRIAAPIAGVAEWERQAAAGTHRVRHHTTPMPQSENPTRWNRVYDPDGRCM